MSGQVSRGSDGAFPVPGDLLDAGIEPVFLVSPALTSGFFTNCATWDTSSGSELYIN